MKKMLLVLGVAAAAMTSCTSDEVVEMQKGSPILFESFVNKNSRAAELTAFPDAGSFYVYAKHNKNGGASLFTNTQVKKIGGYWTTEAPEYWVEDATYQFAAYADGNAGELTNGTEVSWNATNNVLTFTDYVVADKDLVAAHASGIIGATKEPVAMEFKHMLSQVKFTFINTTDVVAGVEMDVKNVQFKAKKIATGTYDPTASPLIAWGTVSGDAATYYYGTKSAITTTINWETTSFFVMPSALGSSASDELLLTFDVDYKLNGNVIDHGSHKASLKVGALASATTWLPGTIYNYEVSLPAKPDYITFEPTVNGWGTAVNIPMIVQNQE